MGRERLSDEDLDAIKKRARRAAQHIGTSSYAYPVTRYDVPALVAEIRELRRDSASNDALAALRGLVDALDQQNKGSGLVPAVLLARSEARRVLASYPPKTLTNKGSIDDATE